MSSVRSRLKFIFAPFHVAFACFTIAEILGEFDIVSGTQCTEKVVYPSIYFYFSALSAVMLTAIVNYYFLDGYLIGSRDREQTEVECEKIKIKHFT